MAGRDERREDDWTNMNGNNNGGLEPDNSIMDRTERTETQTYLAPSSWDTTISPLVEPFIPQQQVEELNYNHIMPPMINIDFKMIVSVCSGG